MNQFDQTIYETALKAGFNPTAAKLIVAQARFESADYTSNVFRNNLNTSGMKFIGQPLASRGTLAPMNERSASCRRGENCLNSDYYAKFNSVADSASDKVDRLFKITRNGVTSEQLKNVKDADEFALLQKKRNYYGFANWNTPQGQLEIRNYANGLKAKLKKIEIDESKAVKEVKKDKTKRYTKYGTIGFIIIAATAISFYYYKKMKK